MIGAIARFIVIEKTMSRFLREPVSVGGAAATVVTATAVIVGASGVLMRLLDHREYPDIFRGMWWALQMTTVGYGDVTPQRLSGRLVAAVVMFEGIALLAIVTAAVTSSFVERAQRARHAAEEAAEQQEEEHLDARFDDLAVRLRAMLRPPGSSHIASSWRSFDEQSRHEVRNTTGLSRNVRVRTT